MNCFMVDPLKLPPEQVFKCVSDSIILNFSLFDKGWSVWDNYLRGGIDSHTLKSLLNRLDWTANRAARRIGRALDYFARSIKLTTLKEKEIISKVCIELGKIGHKINLINKGIDNYGEIILCGNTAAADYILVIDDLKRILEIKPNLALNKSTFKVCDLQNYIKQDSYILLVLNAFAPDIDKLWATFSPKIMKKLLDEVPSGEYSEVGNKMAIQIGDWAKDPKGRYRSIPYDNYFKVYGWDDFSGFKASLQV